MRMVIAPERAFNVPFQLVLGYRKPGKEGAVKM